MPTINTLSLFFAAAAVATAKVTSQGCYSSAGSLQNQGTYIYQSTGYCVDSCSSSVIATTKGNECYCGDEVPPANDKVADSMCNIACVGYPYDKCGGDGYFSVSTNDAGSDAPAMNGTVTASGSMSAPAATSMAAAPSVGSSNATMSSATASASAPAEYTGAAAKPVVGAGAVAMGALFAFL